jgi:tRNA (adenine22-N1)-methyltransferase
MNISNRLKTIADMIDSNYHVIDVGCDHALLDIYLTLNKKIKCTAIDNKENVINYSKENIEKYNLTSKIELIHNDGLENIKIHDDDIIVLAGLGTKTILNIIANKNIKHLIVQSNDDVYNLRYQLTKLNYKVIDEKIVYEKKKYYTIIKLEKGKAKYSKKELEYGPILLKEKNKVFDKYLIKRIDYFEMLLKQVPQKYIIRKLKIKSKIKKLKAILN